MAAGTDPSVAEQVAHGGFDSDHASEAEVADLIFTKVVAEKVEKWKAEYAVAMRRIKEFGFGAKLGSPEYQRLVSEEMDAMRESAVNSHGPFAQSHLDQSPLDQNHLEQSHLDQRHYEQLLQICRENTDDSSSGVDHAHLDAFLPRDIVLEGFSSSDDDAVSNHTRSHKVTPASAMHHKKRSDSDKSESSSSSSSSSESSESSSDSEDDSAVKRTSVPGMGTASACAHLPDELNVQHHVHTIFKAERREEYVCAVCGGRGVGMIYECRELECAGWCSHLRCALPLTKEMARSTKMLQL